MFPCPCRRKSAVVCREVTCFTCGQPGKPLRQRASKACPGLTCCRHPRAPASAAAFEMILSAWACLKPAQGVLGVKVTVQQHHLLRVRDVGVQGPGPGHPKASAHPSCPAFFFLWEFPRLPPPGPQLTACFKFDHFLQEIM